jgi:hypothetical protein
MHVNFSRNTFHHEGRSVSSLRSKPHACGLQLLEGEVDRTRRRTTLVRCLSQHNFASVLKVLNPLYLSFSLSVFTHSLSKFSSAVFFVLIFSTSHCGWTLKPPWLYFARECDTADSRSKRFRYPRFRISAVLFHYYKREYPIRGQIFSLLLASNFLQAYQGMWCRWLA